MVVDRLELIKYNLYQICRVQVALELLKRGVPQEKLQEETEKFIFGIDPLQQETMRLAQEQAKAALEKTKE